MTGVSMLEQRLGLGRIASDHVASWSVRTGAEGRSDRRRAGLWFFGVPTVAALPFAFWHVPLNGIGQVLAGVSTFTALLFGLLFLAFNTGLTLRKDAAVIGSAHDLGGLIEAIRANTTWAICTGLALAVVLVVAAVATDPVDQAPWGFTPIAAWLFVHLGLTTTMILARFRTAFNYITR